MPNPFCLGIGVVERKYRMIPVRYAAVLAMLALVACGPATATVPQVTPTEPLATVEAVGIKVTQEPAPFPLSEPGRYHAGKRSSVFEDPSRSNRQVGITVWYPAVRPAGSSGTPLQVGVNREPDRSGAPYPLILSPIPTARIFAPCVISHGFTWASIDAIDTYSPMSEQAVIQPLDILFALRRVASSPLEGLEGMIDAESAGAIGYSFDGYNALAVSGARVNPEFYLAQCADPDAKEQTSLSTFFCAPAGAWDEFAAHAGEAITSSEDGLWQPMTDERIRAVMPMAGFGWWLFGRRGLAAVDRPTLILVGTQDTLYPENTLIFEHLGTPDKALISFVGLTHAMASDEETAGRMARFAVAFFGCHLQGREDLCRYFSEDFVAQHDDLAWGVYPGE